MDSNVLFQRHLAVSKQREMLMNLLLSLCLCVMMMEASGKQQRLTLLRKLRL